MPWPVVVVFMTRPSCFRKVYALLLVVYSTLPACSATRGISHVHVLLFPYGLHCLITVHMRMFRVHQVLESDSSPTQDTLEYTHSTRHTKPSTQNHTPHTHHHTQTHSHTHTHTHFSTYTKLTTCWNQESWVVGVVAGVVAVVVVEVLGKRWIYQW